MNTSNSIGAISGAMVLALTFHCAADDQIKVYSAPKDHTGARIAQVQPSQAAQTSPSAASGSSMQAQMAAGASNIPVNSSPIHWTLPAGWEQKPADGIRLGSFAIKNTDGSAAEVAITSFPGTVGTELDNVNRWRREVKLEPVGPQDIKSEAITVDGSPGKLYDLSSASARTIVADVMHEGNSWFFKLRGEAAGVTAAAPSFTEFLKSVRFGGEATQAPAVSTTAPTTSLDPHAGLNLPPVGAPPGAAPAADAASDDLPDWKIPSDWSPAPTHMFILKAFSVPGDNGGKAEVTVSSLDGPAGGALMNINRWRGQLGLGPVDEAQLDGVTEIINTDNGKVTLADFAGTDPKTGKPARLVAVIVPHGDKTWFYKLMGDGKVVGGQKDSFVQFVKTVHYH